MEFEKLTHIPLLTEDPAFIALQKLAKERQSASLNMLFQHNQARFAELHYQLDDLLIDFSKQRIDQQVLAALEALATHRNLPEMIEVLFSETGINQSEDRAAMHWALRTPKAVLNQLGIDPSVSDSIHGELEKMYALVEKIHQGQYRGATGEVVTDVVNIGVGGSDLGPLMTSYALADFKVMTEKPLNVHFVSTMDGSQLSELLHQLRPETTLFIISSKSFGTIDTLKNAETVRSWVQKALGKSPEVLTNHFIGVSSNAKAMSAWGIAKERQLYLWDWVGGRYSLWSTIGLPIALTIGVEGFKEFLAGGFLMDEHFRRSPFQQNLPMLIGLIEIWNSNCLNIQTHAVLPYDGRLKYFASYLQQLEMESNGKEITRNLEKVNYATCPIIWGEVGPNAQHAFYQLLHQGTHAVSADFIAPKRRYNDAQFTYSENATELIEQHQLALANCLAQSRLLAFGNGALGNGMQSNGVQSNGAQGNETQDNDTYGNAAFEISRSANNPVDKAIDTPLYKQYEGNQPSTTILIESLTPKTLGMLIALYEHKVFVQSVIWNINPFDQWGVEKGKEIANQLIPLLKDDGQKDIMIDSSTEGLIQYLQGAEPK